MLTRLNSEQLARMTREVDRLFETVAPGVATFLRPAQGSRRPLLNLWQDDTTLFVEAELPGLSLDDVEVFATTDSLTIKGRREAAFEDDSTLLRRERSFGEFERTVDLPVQVDVERIGATLRNGVLRVTLPKAADVLPRRVDVRVGSQDA